MKPIKINKRYLSLFLGIVLAILIIFLISNYLNQNNKYETKESILGYYIQSLENQDKKAMAQLLPPSYSLSNEIDSKLKKFEGKTLGNYTAFYNSTPNPNFGAFSITSEDKTFLDSITVERVRGLFNKNYWVLRLGIDNSIPQSSDSSSINIQSENESVAINVVKNKFPEYKVYPSNNFPPKSIKTEFYNQTWYVAFIQNGSGIPILSANCFTVSSNNVVEKNGSFTNDKHTLNDVNAKNCKGI